MWGNSSLRNIVIGVDPNYQRTQDVVIQTKLARPDVTIANSLDEVVEALAMFL
jgi:hypothetical protein